jgi:transposase
MTKTKQSIPVRDFFKRFPDDESCVVHLFNIRFGQGHQCPKCLNAVKWYRIEAERAFSCGSCGHHIHPTVGTPFEDTRTSLQMWFYAIYLFTTSRHGVSGKELQRQLGVTYKTAWRIGHQIRKHMAMVDGEAPISGDVEIDETFVGGRYYGGKRGAGTPNKTIVFGMLQRGGDLITKIVPSVSKRTLLPLIVENVAKGSTVNTDTWRSYKSLPTFGYKHETVNHSEREYSRGTCNTNSIEAFWRHFKSSINGTHIHVSRKHMEKYAKEFEYRFNSRSNPKAMFPELVSSFAAPKVGSQAAKPSAAQPF